MKTVAKILSVLAIIFIIILGAFYYMLTPSEKIDSSNVNKSNEILTAENLMNNSSFDKLEVVKDPVRLVGELNVPNKVAEDMIYTAMNKSNTGYFKDAQTKVVGGKIKIVSPYKILDKINTQIEGYLTLSVDKGNLVATVSELKVGKITVSDSIVKKIMNKLDTKTAIDIKDNKFIIDNSGLYPLILKDVKVNNKDVKLNIEVEAKNMIEFMKNHKL